MSFKYQSVIDQTDSKIDKNKKDKKTSKYQSVIDQIDSEMEKNKKDKKTSKYQSVIDQIDSEMAGGNTSSGASAPEDRLQSLFDQSNGKDDEAPKKTSKYQDTIDQINAQIEARKEGRELHTVPPAGALENYFDTTMDFLKYGPQSNSTAKGFKQWTEENKGEFIFDRGDVESGVISAAGKKETLSPVHMKAESKTPSATIQAVSDVGVSTKPNSLEDVLARVTILQSEASELDKQKNAAVKVQNNTINDLQREKDLLMQQGSDVDYRRIDDIDRKISEAQNDPRITEIDSKIAEVEEGIYSLYTMITKMSDFNTNSGYVPSVRKDENGQYVNTEPGSIMFPSKKYDESAFGDVKYDAINKNKDAQTIYNNNRFQDDKLGVSGGTSYSDMSRDEIGVYNYLYSQVSPDEANRFLDAIEGSLNARKRYRYTKEVERFAEKHPWISSAAVLATTPLQSVSAIGQIADYVDDGKVDQNAPYNLFSQLPNAAKSEVSQLVEKEWGPVGSAAYNIGMGLGEIITTRGFTLNNRPLGLAVMASRVGADTVIDAKDRGLSDDQAVALGVVAAAAEALTENISWKALESFVDRAGKSELVKYLAKNMITEAGEESISGLSNFLADAVISRDKSELRTSIAHYMSEDGGNLSESQAIKKTFGDMVKSLETDALYGAISGGILAGGYAGVQGIVNRVGSDPFEKQVNKAIKRKNVQLSALDALIAADDAKKINAAAKFINTVSKYSDKSVNSVNAALELMRKQGLEIYEEIKAIDNAGVLPNQSEQEAVQKTRAELQSRYDALVATDEMIRSHLKEIEAARKRNENVEFTDPGAFSAEEITEENVSDIPVSDTKAETSQGDDTANENEDETRYKRYAQAAVQEALNTAEALDSDVAAEQLKRAFGGDLRAAVDALRLSEREIRSGNSRLTTNDISSLRTIDETLRRNNAKYIERAANNLRRSLAKYGVKNVVVGGDDFSGYNNVRNKANYNRSTGVLTVSPYLDTDAVIAASVVHEFTHHGVTHDLALVDDAVSLIDGARSAGVILDNELVYSNYEAAYRDEALNYVRTEYGQSAVKKYTNAGMSATEAQARVIKDYINEELASDFLGILLTKDTNSREFKMFSGQNRNVIQRILDAITSFIRRIKGENANADVKQYERAVELLRGVLNNHTANQAKTNSGNPVSTAAEAVAKAEDAEARAEPYTEPEVVDSVVSDTNDSVVDVAEEKVAEAEAAEEEGVRDTVNEEFESLFDSPGEYYEDTYKETENVEETTEENLAESDSTSEEKYDITEEDYETLDYILGLDSEGETEKYDITEEDYETLDYILRTSDGEAVAYDAGDGSVRWSIDTYRKNGRDTLMRYIQSRVDSGSLSKADGNDIVKTMDRICEICETMTGEYAPFGEWSYASVEVDKNGNPVFSVIKPNGEYIMNLDFSLVCKKRRALDAVFNEMIRRGVISKFDIGQDKIVKINDIIRKNGLEVACSACFVDAKRFRQSKVADDFVKMYNSLVRSMAKGADAAYFNFGGDSSLPDIQNGIDTLSDSELDMTTINKLVSEEGKSVRHKIAKHLAEHPADRKLLSRGDFMSTRGFNLVKKVNPDVLSLYNSKKGSGGPKASFGDVQYLSDIIRSGKFNADKAYSVGGVRVQSFSDYVARLVFDYVQMVGDLAAKELPAHAYTKEVLFVKQFGLTGMKINMSLMPAVGDGKYAGLNADGSYAWANESFDYDAAMEIQSDPEYAKNCGTIAVGISDQHIWKLLSDPNIRMVIPYHKSGINPVVAEMNKINRFTNYTNDQNTRYKDGKKLSAEDAKGVPNFNELMHNGMNAVEASRAYVEWCESKGYKPKFDRFAYNSDGTFNENYYKLLEDFTTMVDGVYHPQGAVKAVFPDENSAFGSMEQLIREGLEQDAVDQFARDEKVGGIVDEVVAMLEGGDDVRFSKDVGENDSVKIQIRNNLTKLNYMNPVANINYTVKNRGKAREDADAVFKATGYKVDRQGFGVIEIGPKQLSESSNYLNTPAEFAAWMCVPKVLKRGVEISGHDDHKSRGFSSVTIAAPVVINGKRGNVGVVVQRTSKSKYHVHRILMPDGSAFEYENIQKNAEPTGDSIPEKVSGKRLSISSASDTSIADSDGNVNTSEVNSDIRYAKDVADVRSTEEKLRVENEYLKRQFMSRNGDEWAKAVSPEDVRRVSREIAKDLPGVAAGAVEAEFAEVVKVLQRKLTKDYSADARYRDAVEAAKAAAAKLIMQTDKVTVNNEWLDIRDLKKKLRDTKVYVSENVASEIPDWQSVRKEISGALSVVTTDRSALPLDSFYSELAEEYPEYFPAEIKIPQQQMERVIKVAKELKEIRQYNHETLWVDAEDTGDTISAEMANSDLVQSFANVILAKYNESAMETLAAQLRREKDSQRWDSNSTRNMLAELQREIPLAQENAKQTIERHMRATRQKVSQFMALYNEQMDALKAEVEQANADAEWLSNRLAHHDERTKITTQRKRYSRNLKTLYNLLTKPTDKRHIPEGLQRAVIDLLSNFSGVKLDNGQTIDPEVLRNLKGRFSMENSGDAVGALERLVNVVRLNKTSADFSVSDGFIDDLQRTVDLAKEILNEPKTLSKGELQDQIDYYAAYGQNYFAQREFEYLSQVNRVLSMVQKYINDSNKVFLGGKREYAADMADQVAYEMRNRSKRSNVPDNALLGADNRPTEFAYDQMQADTFWHMFGDFGDMIMKSYRRAQNYQMEHEAEYADWVKKNIFDVFKNGKGKRYNTHDLGWGGSLVTVSANGKKFEITKAQLMSCYVTWNQPEGKTHMTNGGVFFKSQKGEEVESRHVVFTDESFAKLMENLSEQDKTVCDKIVKFLSKRGAAWGNEASMYLYGYKKFMKDYYFPIMAAKSALPVNWDQMTEFSKLESKGMTKARKGDAKNAILIDDFFDVADNHVRNMAAYSAFAPLNNDVRRIFDMGKAQSAVKSVLGDKTTGGKNKKMGGWGYLVDFLQNVDKNKVMAAEQLSSSKALRILSSMYKRQAVSASLSTALKQPTSYVRAWNVLDGKYLTMAFADKSFVPGSSEYKRIMKDMAEHSGVAKMKLLGYSDTGSAKSLRAIYDSNHSVLGDEFTNAFARNAVKGYEKTSDLFMIAAETMDKWTWIRIWKACELEVDAKNKGLSRHERTEAVSELFNQVIGETQVVDTVLDSTPALRNSDGLIQQMYAFMKEPIKTVNTVFRAWDDVKTGKKGAKKAMTKALVTFAVSNMILEPLISALFGMLRDEEDEEGIFLQKLGNSMFGIPMKGERFNLLDVLTSESVSSIYNTIPIVEEFADVLFSRLQGYDIERMDVTGLTKAIDAVVALCEYDSKKTKTFGNTVSDVVTSFAGLFGIPAYTLKRDVSAAFRLWYQWTDNYEAQWDLNKLFYNLNNGTARSQKNFYDIIGHVIREGDEDAYQYIREDLSNVFTSDRKGLSANDMLKYMEDRKVEFDYTSRLWNIELQASFDLPQFVSNMKVEPLITDVYRKTGDSSVLPIPPSDNFKVKADAKFSDKLVWNSEKDEEEDSRTVTFKNQADLAEYTEKVGDYAYKTLLCFVDNSLYKRLNDEQKAYAVKQVYKFAQAKFKTELYTDYDPNNKDFAWHIKRGSSPDLVARDILNAAWNYES